MRKLQCDVSCSLVLSWKRAGDPSLTNTGARNHPLCTVM
jgi:hypothetical protein